MLPQYLSVLAIVTSDINDKFSMLLLPVNSS